MSLCALELEICLGDFVSSTTVLGWNAHKAQCLVLTDFKLVINDLSFNTAYAKYVDDTIQCSRFQKNVNDDTLQAYADYLVHWTQSNGMIINTNKTKELIICFKKKVNTSDIP